MNKEKTFYKLAYSAIKTKSEIDIYRLYTLISRSENPEKLIPYIKGEKYILHKNALINGLACFSENTNLYDVLINDKVEYSYWAEDLKTVYINPSKFSSAKEINEAIKDIDELDYSEEQTDHYFYPIAIPNKIKMYGTCTYEEWENSCTNKNLQWNLN